MNVRFEMQDGHGVAIVSGSLNASSVGSFREQVDRWMGENPGMMVVVVDLSAVEFLDSAGLGALLALLRKAGERGGDVRLAGLQKAVRLVFEITRTYKVFDIFDSAAEALRAP